MPGKHPTPEERHEPVTVPEGIDPEEFLARLLAVDPDELDGDQDDKSE